MAEGAGEGEGEGEEGEGEEKKKPFLVPLNTEYKCLADDEPKHK